MEFFVDITQVTVGDMGINLGSTDISVTQECLDAAQVGSVGEKVSSKEVAHGVWGHFFANTGFNGTRLHYPFDRPVAKTESFIIFLHYLPIFGELDK